MKSVRQLWAPIRPARLCFLVFLLCFAVLFWHRGQYRDLRKFPKTFGIHLTVANKTAYAESQGFAYRKWVTYWHERSKAKYEARRDAYEQRRKAENRRCRSNPLLTACKYQFLRPQWGNTPAIDRQPTLYDYGVAMFRTSPHLLPFATTALMALIIAVGLVYAMPVLAFSIGSWLTQK